MKKFAIAAIAATTIAVTIACAEAGHADDPEVPGYMVANYTINDQQVFQQYLDAATPLAPRFGGKVIVFNLQSNAVEGQARSVMAIAEFPSLADAQRFYDSPEYTAAKQYRLASTEGTVVITEGVPLQ